jgi:mannonate dehydratase
MRSIEPFQRVVDLVPSECNGITFCQGNLALMTDDVPAAIRHFGEQVVPTLHGESNDRPGYSTLGRLFAVGYIKGLREALFRRR